MAQTYEEPRCQVTGKPFYPVETHVAADLVEVSCSECAEVLETYSV